MKRSAEDNRIKILLVATAIVAVIAIAAIIGVILSGMQHDPNADTGERITGDYTLSVSSGSFAASGGYSFDGSDNAVETYVDPSTGETVTNRYTYIMTVDKDGNKYIVFTCTEGKNVGKTTSHGYYNGTLTDEHGVKRNFISINETFYYEVKATENNE